MSKFLRQGKISVDQLLLPGGGRFSAESLSKGLTVIPLMAYEKYPQGFPRGYCPIIDADVWNIKSVLKETILDLEKRKKLSIDGVKYVNEVCLARVFVKTLVDLVDCSKIPYDYTPQFFINNYKTSGKSEQFFQNMFLRLIRKEAWYKEISKSKRRRGLNF